MKHCITDLRAQFKVLWVGHHFSNPFGFTSANTDKLALSTGWTRAPCTRLATPAWSATDAVNLEQDALHVMLQHRCKHLAPVYCNSIKV